MLTGVSSEPCSNSGEHRVQKIRCTHRELPVCVQVPKTAMICRILFKKYYGRKITMIESITYTGTMRLFSLFHAKLLVTAGFLRNICEQAGDIWCACQLQEDKYASQTSSWVRASEKVVTPFTAMCRQPFRDTSEQDADSSKRR